MNVLSPRVVTIHEQALRSYDSRTGSPSAGLWGSTISDRVNGPSTHTPSPAQAPSCVVSPPPPPLHVQSSLLASGVTLGAGEGVRGGGGGRLWIGLSCRTAEVHLRPWVRYRALQ